MSAPEIVETPLVRYVPGMQPVPVDVPGTAVLTIDGTVYIHRVRLTVHQPEKLLQRQSIRLLVATHTTSPRLKDAELIVTGTTCRYVTVGGARFQNNSVVQFSRAPGCDPRMAVTTGDLELVLQFDTPGRPALWSFTQPDWMPVTGAISITDPAVPLAAARPALRGEFEDQFRGGHIRVIHLLAAMWQMPFSGTPLILLLLVALTALIGAVLLYPLNLLPADTSAAVAVKAGVGGGLLAFGFALAFAVTTPPFQAPDEPSHFLGLLSLAGRSAEVPAAERWAMSG